MSYMEKQFGFYPDIYIREANSLKTRSFYEIVAQTDDYFETNEEHNSVFNSNGLVSLSSERYVVTTDDADLTVNGPLDIGQCVIIKIEADNVTIDGLNTNNGDILVSYCEGSSWDTYFAKTNSTDLLFRRVGVCSSAEIKGEAGEATTTTSGKSLVVSEAISYSIEDLNYYGDYHYLRGLNNIDLAYIDWHKSTRTGLGASINNINSNTFFDKEDHIKLNISGEANVRNIDGKLNG